MVTKKQLKAALSDPLNAQFRNYVAPHYIRKCAVTTFLSQSHAVVAKTGCSVVRRASSIGATAARNVSNIPSGATQPVQAGAARIEGGCIIAGRRAYI